MSKTTLSFQNNIRPTQVQASKKNDEDQEFWKQVENYKTQVSEERLSTEHISSLKLDQTVDEEWVGVMSQQKMEKIQQQIQKE